VGGRSEGAGSGGEVCGARVGVYVLGDFPSSFSCSHPFTSSAAIPSHTRENSKNPQVSPAFMCPTSKPSPAPRENKLAGTAPVWDGAKSRFMELRGRGMFSGGEGGGRGGGGGGCGGVGGGEEAAHRFQSLWKREREGLQKLGGGGGGGAFSGLHEKICHERKKKKKRAQRQLCGGGVGKKT